MPGQEKKDDMKTSLAPAEAATDSAMATPAMYLAQRPTPLIDAGNDGRWWRRPRSVRGAIARAVNSMRSLGPYLAIELILPGGSIIALALWTYRHRRAARERANAASTAAAPALLRAPLRCVAHCTQR